MNPWKKSIQQSSAKQSDGSGIDKFPVDNIASFVTLDAWNPEAHKEEQERFLAASP